VKGKTKPNEEFGQPPILKAEQTQKRTGKSLEKIKTEQSVLEQIRKTKYIVAVTGRKYRKVESKKVNQEDIKPKTKVSKKKSKTTKKITKRAT